ncbi:tudor domain-containing protein 5-like [Clytia hemisphaerica]|uniref:tudor domain-containing protein 5-like n=1 Tax=Clytia hemisphaerica TaxID=252671 RepID=UPI0034D62CC1
MMDEVKKIVRALLISTKNGLSVSELCSEYSLVASKPLPYKELGYYSAVELVKDMPDVVRPIFISGGVMLLKGIADSSTAHINELVRHQKSVRYNTKIVTNVQQKPVKMVVPDYVRTKISKLIATYPRGVEIKNFEESYKRRYGRKMDCQSFGFNDMKEVIMKCQDIVKVKHPAPHIAFLYPTQQSLKKEEERIPLFSNPQQSQANHFAPLPNRHQQSRSYYQQLTDPISKNSALPQSVKMEIYTLLTKFKFGLPAAKFIFEYKQFFQKSFQIHTYGFHSVIEMMSKIPDIVKIERPQSGGDWILRSVATQELPAIVSNNKHPSPTKQVGDKIKCYISYIISPSSFWYQDKKYVSELDELMERMNEFYNSVKGDLFTSLDFQPGQICCALYSEDNQWYRAIVKSKVSKDTVKVHYIDYGNETTVEISSLRLLLQEFYTLQHQAQQGRLADIEPCNDIWSDLGIKEFFNQTQDQELLATVVKVDRAHNLVLAPANDDSQNIAQILSFKGFGNMRGYSETINKDKNSQKGSCDQEQINNLKNYYQNYYQALKDVSQLSTKLQQNPVIPKTVSPTPIQQPQNVSESIKLMKSLEVTEHFVIHMINYKDEAFVAGAEISHLFWNVDILRQMARQKRINLVREIITSEDSPKLIELCKQEDVKGMLDCGTNQSLIVYNLTEVPQLFQAFKPIHENSKALIEKEIEMLESLKEKYWDANNMKMSEAESAALQIQALKFKKKRLYMSMITNAAKENTMDEILAIEKEINLLSIG